LERREDALSVSGAKILVVGGAVTGISVSRFLAKRGAHVTLTDSSLLSGKEEEISHIKDMGVSLDLGGHKIENFKNSDLIVLSPGVPLYIEPMLEARRRKVRIMGEVELAYRYLEAPILAVTGTNGKTTTTAILGDMLKGCGMKVKVGGNIGEPLIDLVDGSGDLDFVVAEISSFQLEAIEEFRPYVAILTNITPDHLDRYKNFEEYVLAKMNIFKNQKASDFAVLNGDDEEVLKRKGEILAKKIFFSRTKEEKDGVFLKDGKIKSMVASGSFAYDPGEYPIRGVHNMENIMAAIAASAVVGCGGENLDRAIKKFRPISHRLELVNTVGGVGFYNDSKATNVGAALKSIESFDGGIHLIMGGVDKGGSYRPLIEPIRERVVSLYLIGEAKDKIKNEIGGIVPTFTAEGMEQAVTLAFERASSGDVVLLAPACSSFDMYENYKVRGEHFKEITGRFSKSDG
jgi:UDP-N-acetylmuramoylalanine--D-glutamate ligase